MQNSKFVRPLVVGIGMAAVLLAPVTGITRSADASGASRPIAQDFGPMVRDAEVKANVAVWSWV